MYVLYMHPFNETSTGLSTAIPAAMDGMVVGNVKSDGAIQVSSGLYCFNGVL